MKFVLVFDIPLILLHSYRIPVILACPEAFFAILNKSEGFPTSGNNNKNNASAFSYPAVFAADFFYWENLVMLIMPLLEILIKKFQEKIMNRNDTTTH